MSQDTEHHIWCNDFFEPREGCEMCKELYRECPIDGMTEEELMKKHFPQNEIYLIQPTDGMTKEQLEQFLSN